MLRLRGETICAEFKREGTADEGGTVLVLHCGLGGFFLI